MSRSGVAVNDSAVSAYNDLKLGKSHKFIIYKLSDDLSEIVVETTSKDTDYESFLAQLPETDCRYAVYDFEYQLGEGEGTRNKITFFTWSPDTAKIKSKMVYASSKDAIRRALNGVAAEVQGTDFSEVAFDAVLEKVAKGGRS